MNFLLGNHDEDHEGWEEEDDIDLSEEASVENAYNGQNNQNQTRLAYSQHQQQQENNHLNHRHQNGGVQLGAGMFMGRLTRFIESVTNPDDEDGDDDDYDEDESNGWRDDEGGLGDIVDAEYDDGTGEGPGGWEDDNINIGEEEQSEDITPPNVSTLTSQAVAESYSSRPDVFSDQRSGWSDDLDLSSQLMNTSTFSLGTPLSRDTPPVRHLQPDEIVPLNDSPANGAVARSSTNSNNEVNDNSSGWNDGDDIDFENLDISEDQTNNESTVFISPPPVPPPDAASQPLRVQSSQLSSVTLGSSLIGTNASTTAATAATGATSFSETAEDGWDDDELNAGDLEGHEDANLIAPDLSPPSRIQGTLAGPSEKHDNSACVNVPSVSFAEGKTTFVASNSEAAGWDGDDVEVDADIRNIEEPGHVLPSAHDSTTAKMVDLTPPPPPPPLPTTNGTINTAGARTDAAVMIGSENPSLEDGWEEDDTANDFLDEANRDLNGDYDDDNDSTRNENSEEFVVDHIPPPSPEPRHHATVDATCDEDDDISRDDTLSMANSRSYHQQRQSARASFHDSHGEANHLVVDRTPEEQGNAIAFQKDGMEGGPNNRLSLTSQLGESSMAVLYEATDSNSLDSFSVRSGMGDSITTASTANTGGAAAAAASASTGAPIFAGASAAAASRPITKPRRMVDYTPRFSRGTSGDASLAVAGHTSVGESLDSIDEENEEEDSEGDDKMLQGFLSSSKVKSPSFQMAQGNPPSGPILSSATAEGTAEIPMGSAELLVTHNNQSNFSTMPPLAPYDDVEESSHNDDLFPVVDHTPRVPQASNRSIAGASVEVLSDSSEEGDLGESDVGVDDIKDDLYGPMVDHTPMTPNHSLRENLRTLSAASNSNFSVEGSSRQVVEDDTVAGHAEKKDVEYDIQKDDEMDEDLEGEESSRGESSTFGVTSVALGTVGEDNRSLLSGRLPVVDESEYLVDHVPEDKSRRTMADASTMVLLDTSSNSSRVEDNVDDDGTNVAGFGPIVDHTPSLVVGQSRTARSIATSVVTQISGLAGEIKEDEELDNSTLGFTERGLESASAGDREDLELERKVSHNTSENHIVDHVPKRRGQRVTLDASVRVLVDKDDESTQVDTIAEDAAVDYGPIVDHTPYSSQGRNSSAFSIGASMITQASEPGESGKAAKDDDFDNTTTMGGASSGWDQDETELEDISVGVTENAMSGPVNTDEENNLVDHVPTSRHSFSKPTDASTMVLVDPLDAASEADDDDDDTAGNARSDRFGPVVDQTPAPRSLPVSVAASMLTQVDDIDTDVRQDDDMDGTWFGASTVGGVSTVGASSAAAGGSSEGDNESGTGWDDDAHVLDELNAPASPGRIEDHLVDHVPSVTSHQQVETDASMAVVVDQSVVSSQAQEDAVAEDEKVEEELFGAVVDHTPSVDPIPRHSIANSLATLATGVETDIKRDEEMDETTWQGGVSTQGEGWDQDEPELEELADSVNDEVPHVVDHVPERPESRPVDPSLIVAADPSEMSSQVDDFNQDEQNFGPVVDQTPVERVIPPPAVGSTVVALPSVLNDDLDEGDGDEQTAVEVRPPNEWEEQLPNPQSGNDEDSSREQLVDFIPPPEEELPDLVRDGSSEMATVDEKSTLPAEDPREDEFGPVVDHTPPAGSTIDRRTSGVRDSNDDESDRKPAAEVQNNIDSVAPMYSVGSKGKDDVLDEDEFGPVVDHLPTGSSRASLTPSRGGSTVDALATVSEVEDDMNTRDGWDEDTIDLTDPQSSPTVSAHRATDDKSYTVTWGDNVYQKENISLANKNVNSSRASQSTGESGFFDAEMGELTRLSLNETKYYDPEAAAVSTNNGWGDDSLTFDSNHNIADDDTPPSTPRPSIGYGHQIPACIAGCQNCSSATTTDCPCVQSLLELNGNTDNMVGYLKTKDGESVKINFQKLLQTETAKRLLVEKESEALRTTVKSLKSTKDDLITAGCKDELMAATAEWQETNKKLSEDILQFESECTQLRNMNDILSNELKSVQKVATDLETEKSQIHSREESLLAELLQVKDTLHKQLERSSSDSVMKNEIERMRLEINSKSTECSELNTQINRLQEKLNKSEADNFKYTKDFTTISKEHNAVVINLESRLGQYQKQLEQAQTRSKDSIKAFELKVTEQTSSVEKLQEERDSLKKQNEKLRENQARLSRENQLKTSEKDSLMKSLQAQLNEALSQKERLVLQTTQLNDKVKETHSLSSHLESLLRERDDVKKSLLESNTRHAELQKQIRELSTTWEAKCSQQISDMNTMKQEKLKHLSEIESSKNEVANLSRQIESVEREKKQLQLQIDELKKARSSSAAPSLDAIKSEAKVKTMENEIQQLRKQLQLARDDMETSQNERQRLSDHCTVLEGQVNKLSEGAGQSERLKNDLKGYREKSEAQHSQIQVLEHKLSENEHLLKSKEHAITSLQNQQETSQLQIRAIQGEKSGLMSELSTLKAQLFELRSLPVPEIDNSILDTVRSQLREMTSERDLYRKERDMFEEENEEMLIQFGMLKEHMDKTELELEKMQEKERLRERELQEAIRNCHNSEERLEALTRDFALLKASTSGHTTEWEKLRESLIKENKELLGKIDALAAERQDKEIQIQNMEDEKSDLTATIQDLREQVNQIVSDSEGRRSELQATIDKLNAQNAELGTKIQEQKVELSNLRIDLENSKAAEDETTNLRNCLTDFETRLCSQDRLLSEKDGELHVLKDQLENAGAAPADSAQIESLKEIIQDLEWNSADKKMRLQEMKNLCGDTQQELNRTMEQLQATEALAEQLRHDLEAKSQQESSTRILEAQLSQIEQELITSRTEESRHRDEAFTLRQELATLEMELRESTRLYEQPAKEPSGQGSAEIEALRQQIEGLKREQLASSSQTGAREEMIEREVHTLQEQMRVKDSQISNLERQIHTLGNDLSSSHKQLASKEKCVEKLSFELEMLRSKLSDPSSRVLESTQEEAESVDEMRSHIVSLAKALEMSENRRADVIERIEKERQANADSLRRMTESMKRFYSTLNFE